MASLEIQKQEAMCKSTTSFSGRKEGKTASGLADDLLFKLTGTAFTKHNRSFISCVIYSVNYVNHMKWRWWERILWISPETVNTGIPYIAKTGVYSKLNNLHLDQFPSLVACTSFVDETWNNQQLELPLPHILTRTLHVGVALPMAHWGTHKPCNEILSAQSILSMSCETWVTTRVSLE